MRHAVWTVGFSGMPRALAKTHEVCLSGLETDNVGLPGREYWFNEQTNCQWRVRDAARDIGAFESTSLGPSFGPYHADPLPRLRIAFSRANAAVTCHCSLRRFGSSKQFQQGCPTGSTRLTPTRPTPPVSVSRCPIHPLASCFGFGTRPSDVLSLTGNGSSHRMAGQASLASPPVSSMLPVKPTCSE